MNADAQPGPSLLERIDLAMASHLVTGVGHSEPLAAAQRVFDVVRRPAPGDALFLASALRLRGFVVTDEDAVSVVTGTPGRLSPITQEYRLIRGLRECLRRVRARASDGKPPDGWFLVDLWRAMTAELPRFRNNELRRGPPWDAVLYVNYPNSDELRYLLDTFDAAHHLRDLPGAFLREHPVRQGFRLMWRFAHRAVPRLQPRASVAGDERVAADQGVPVAGRGPGGSGADGAAGVWAAADEDRAVGSAAARRDRRTQARGVSAAVVMGKAGRLLGSGSGAAHPWQRVGARSVPQGGAST